MPETISFSPSSNEFLDDPNRVFAFMRRHSPTFISEGQHSRLVSVFDYDTIRQCFADWRRYSSVIPEMRDLFLGEAEIVIQEDPPLHTEHRQLMQSFIGDCVRSIVPEFRSKLEHILIHQKPTNLEFVEEVAAKLALFTTARIVGIPDATLPYIRDWTNRLSRVSSNEFMDVPNEVLETQKIAVQELHVEFTGFLNEQLSSVAEFPSQSLFGVLSDLKRPQHEWIALGKLLLFSSNHTSSLQLSNAVYLLATHSSQLGLLRQRADLIDKAVEEILRFMPVFRLMNRRSTEDHILGGVEVHRGDDILLWISSANRDESIFDDSDRFNIERNYNRHLAFGAGPHVCIGAQLARLELRTLLQVILANNIEFELAGTPNLLRDPWVDGLQTLEIQLV